MNKRIKELAKQSDAWEYYEINEGVDGDDKPLEKFAQLIVRECANIDFRARVGLSHEDDHEISRTIREHFGVEE